MLRVAVEKVITLLLRWPNWQRRNVEGVEVVGSNPTLGIWRKDEV